MHAAICHLRRGGDNVLCGQSKPLGEIEDFFWRVEFQQRGSPHIHALLWIKDAPDVLKLSESEEGRAELAAFVDRSISVLSKSLQSLETCPCNTCTTQREEKVDILAVRPPDYGTNEWGCDLSHLVQRVQQHICYTGTACRKKSSESRFGYPKPLQSHTEIEAETASDGTPSLTVKLKREVLTINNYSPLLLSSWRANVDIQLIGNAYGAAEYAGAYVSKAEPDTVRFRKVIAGAFKRSDLNLPHYAILKRIANAALSIREVSAQEAIYILLRELPLHGKSRTVTKVKVLRHNLRCYRVERKDLQNIVRIADVAGPKTRIEPIESAYMARPNDTLFNTMSFPQLISLGRTGRMFGTSSKNEGPR
ncbi:unnamed protein product [Phytophthora fragariaefolia]|uniref:Unnamed protein product n=1 Tax=Phytophthora fragariaefolia TaxID=1490495 RepID=A0A9W6YGA9_9STRA|nr:unnamed protein product [Phytophthora fragariaefolia]